MKRSLRIALGIAGVLVVVALIAIVVENNKYEFLWASPAISHDTLVTADTCVQVVIRPDAALSSMPKLLPNLKVPPSFLGMVLPYEIAFLCAADPSTGHAGVTLFVNDRRFGPILRESASGIAASFPSVTWTSAEMKRESRGKLTMEGTATLKRAALDAVAAYWSSLGSYTPLKVEGKHLFEAAFDNRWGGAFAFMTSLPKDHTREANFFQDENTVKMLAGVSVVRVTADLAEGNTANVDVDVLTNPQANMIFGIKLLLDGAIAPLNESLKNTFGATITGTSVTDGDSIKGHYVVSNVDKILDSVNNPRAR